MKEAAEMKLDEKLVTLRKEQGLSQMEVAEKLGVSRQAVSRWEVGLAMPSTGNLQCLSALYGVPADYLLNDQSERSEQTAPVMDEPSQANEPPSKKPVKRIIMLLLLIAMLTASMGGGVLIGMHMRTEPDETERVVLSDRPGDRTIVGDMVADCMTKDEMDMELDTAGNPPNATTPWKNVLLSGTDMSRSFEVLRDYQLPNIWIANQDNHAIGFVITKGTDIGPIVKDCCYTIPANSVYRVRSTKPWDPDMYYCNFVSGVTNGRMNELKGTISCRLRPNPY